MRMTAQVAILNRQGIALASDSAITAQSAEGQKISLSANKIFALSKYHPIAIMIYNNANFMGIPWETIIKIYREELGLQNFNTLNEHAENFIQFLNKQNHLFPVTEQEKFLRINVYSYYNLIYKDIRAEIEKSIQDKGQISIDEVKATISKIIEDHYKVWKNTRFLPNITKTYYDKILKKYETTISEGIKRIFEKLPLTATQKKKLKEIAGKQFVKICDEVLYIPYTGIVIAGYGKQDFFPKLRSYNTYGILNNRLKYQFNLDQSVEIDFQDNDAAIIPFAQTEMVNTFMEGVDPKFQLQFSRNLIILFQEYTEIILNSITPSPRQQFKNEINKKGIEMLKSYLDKQRDFRYNNYIEPVISVISFLPISDLAGIAESLVNLTSLKRKVSMEEETVGGAIDVAVISKGDGLIWIKRKHYFNQELNRHFLANYYRGGEIKQNEKQRKA